MYRVVVAAVAAGSLFGSVRGGEIGWIEEFVLAPDRTVALRQLVPGTEDYYYYHCLHYQNTEQWAKADEMLAAWIRRYQHTPRVLEIENRQALLLYDRDPKRALDLIRRRLDLRFDHKRERLDPAADLPTRLDPALINRKRLVGQAFAPYPSTTEGFEDAALESLLDLPLNPDQRRHLLSRLRRPDHPKLVEAVVADLSHENSGGFGQFEIHRQLLLAQLDELLKLKPELRNQQNFVNTYLAKLHPSADANWRQDRDELRAYLDRLWGVVSGLEPVHNSLKAHVLYHRLVLDRSRGEYDRDRFLAYLRLPRGVHYASPVLRESEHQRLWPADLRADYGGVTMLPPVGDDEPLVRSYLEHFLLDAENYDDFLPFVHDEYLKHLFAETKITAGLGDPERWASLLPPERYRQLKERVDLDFAFTNRTEYGPGEPVGLDLFVKNVDTLLVKVFEINAEGFYREHGREVGPDIDLDGLVANHERTHRFDEPPVRRVRRHFEFPELKDRGVYVIDFIGNGTSSRAVIRKGRLNYLVRTGAAGQAFTILDEQRRPVPGATLWMAGRLYTADEKGVVLTPFSNEPGAQPVVLSSGGFSSLDVVEQQSENYLLTAGVYIDREELLGLRKARVLIRPNLSIHGTPISVKALQDVRLVVTSTDLDGVPTVKEVRDFAIADGEESVYEFQVPPRLASVRFTLAAKVQVQSRNEKIDLSAGQSFSVNEIDRTERIEDLHLVRAGGEYFLDLLGKSGEVQAGRAVRVSLKLRDFREPVEAALATDAAGRVTLGSLAGVEVLTATGPDGATKSWPLRRDERTYRSAVHGETGGTVEIPYMGATDKIDREAVSLLELRGETFAADRLDTVSVEDGLLKIAGLPPGDYSLLLKEHGVQIRLRLTEGNVANGYVLGEHRRLELRDPQPLQLAAIETADGKVRIRVRNVSPGARVHVFATRFVPAFSAFSSLGGVVTRDPYLRFASRPESLYVAGRDIGDEYRYVIERRYAKKYPGNMLDRPGLLLNPWVVHDTETGEQLARQGEEFQPAPAAEPSASAGGTASASEVPPQTDPANLDFLAETSVVLTNLTPNDEGVIEFSREDLGPHQDLLVVAVDAEQTVSRHVSLPEVRPRHLDLRLVKGLDPAKHFMRQRRVSVLGEGEKLEFADVTSTRFEVYDSLDRVFALYAALNPDPKLAEFRFLANWHRLEPEKKRELYSNYASHELHLFLYEKDPEFFRAVVRPYLENKLDKTFLDEWLLGRDLSAYREPWRFGRLNTLERILLGRRIDEETSAVARHVRERFELLPPQEDRFERIFQTALLGRALEAPVLAGVELRQQRDADGAEPGNGAFSGVGGAFGGGGFGRRAGAIGGQSAGDLPAMDFAAPAEEAERLYESESRSERLMLGLKRPRGRGLSEDLMDQDLAALGKVVQYYVQLDKTKEWAENNYYRVPNHEQTPDLIPVGAFWAEYAAHDPARPFRSRDLADATRTFPEMLTALALLDLPFEPGEHETTLDGARMTLAAASPLVVYHEEVLPAGVIEGSAPVLVNQNVFRHDDRYRQEGNLRVDKFVTDEFLVDVVYGCQVVVTNPTSTPRQLDVLLQVPVGAVPVLNGRPTKGVRLDLAPYGTQVVEYHFYFPTPGDFAHYPVQVSDGEKALAAAASVTFHVVAEPSRVDAGSWAYVSQHGSDEEVLAFLETKNVQRLDLARIAFRMKDPAFFERAIALLSARHAYDRTLWSYGVFHGHAPTIREFLRHADEFVAQTGEYLRSPLLVIDPVLRKTYEHLEYAPLVNARVAKLGRRREILNDRFLAQYQRLMRVLSYRRQLDDRDLMEVTYYLLLQERIEEALDMFGRVNADSLETRLQYDYFAAYLDFYRSEPQRAREVAARYLDHPVERWRQAFANVVHQADEIAGGDVLVADAEDRTQVQTGRAAETPSFEFVVEGDAVRLSHQNLDAVRVNYYLMDVELLFSRSPFAQDHGRRFSHIRPNLSRTVDLPGEKGVFEFPLPDELSRANVLVEIEGAGRTQSRARYANSLLAQVIEDYGQLRVTDPGGTPLPKVYVKAYVRMRDGNVRFYRDGYTDLRGRFDYSSLNTNELGQVERFSLLVLSDDRGAVVREAEPPKQ